MLEIFVITLILGLPIAIPAFIIALIVHLHNKKQRQNNLNIYGDPNYVSRFDADTMTNTANLYQPMPQPAQLRSEKPKKHREPMSSSAVMLLIGTALVVLSGIAFGAANWLSTSPLGRVFIICIASVVAFIISFIFMKLVKLKGTSSAFFMVGSLLIPVALVIASYYFMLGRWLSFEGGGRFLMFASAFMITSVGCFIGHKIYKTNHFVYSGLSMLSAALLFIALQTALIDNETSMSVFASMLMIFQTILTAIIYIFRVHEKTQFSEPIKLISTITSVGYALIYLSYAIATSEDPTFGTFFIYILAIAQLIGYGISKNQKWMLVIQTILSVMLAFITSIKLNNEELLSDAVSINLFLAMVTVIFLFNRFVPKMRNVFSVSIALASMSLGSMAALNEGINEGMLIPLFFSVLTSAIIYLYCFDRRTPVQIAAGLISPALPLVIASDIRIMLRIRHIAETPSNTHIVYGTAAIIFVAITAVIMALPKFAFDFHANHPRKTDIVLYANMAAPLLILMPHTHSSAFLVIPIIALVAHFCIANTMKNNIMAVGSGVLFSVYLMQLLEDYAKISDAAMLSILFSSFLMIMAISKIVFGKAIISKKDGRIVFDTALLSGWVIIPYMMDLGNISEFFVYISAAVFTACLIKKNTKDDIASVLLSISAFLSAMALFERPFLLTENEMITNKISFAIVAMLGAAFRIIWRKHEKGAKIASNVIFISTFSALMIDALYFENAGNTVFVLAVTTAILIVSFMIKSKVWFSVSSIAIAAIILYSAKDFLGSLSGWVYLFAAGLILIGIAAINEYYKQKGENVKSKLAGVFSDWRW